MDRFSSPYEAISSAQDSIAASRALIDKINGYLGTSKIKREQLRFQGARQPARRDPSVEAAAAHLDREREELLVIREELGRVKELARQERDIKSGLHRYRELFVCAPDALVVTCRRGLVRELNPAARALLPPAEGVYPLATVIAREHVLAFRGALAAALEQGFVDRIHLRLKGRKQAGARLGAAVRRIGSGHLTQVLWSFREERVVEDAALHAGEPFEDDQLFEDEAPDAVGRPATLAGAEQAR